jgi:hypothetical protein
MTQTGFHFKPLRRAIAGEAAGEWIAPASLAFFPDKERTCPIPAKTAPTPRATATKT